MPTHSKQRLIRVCCLFIYLFACAAPTVCTRLVPVCLCVCVPCVCVCLWLCVCVCLRVQLLAVLTIWWPSQVARVPHWNCSFRPLIISLSCCCCICCCCCCCCCGCCCSRVAAVVDAAAAAVCRGARPAAASVLTPNTIGPAPHYTPSACPSPTAHCAQSMCRCCASSLLLLYIFEHFIRNRLWHYLILLLFLFQLLLLLLVFTLLSLQLTNYSQWKRLCPFFLLVPPAPSCPLPSFALIFVLLRRSDNNICYLLWRKEKTKTEMHINLFLFGLLFTPCLPPPSHTLPTPPTSFCLFLPSSFLSAVVFLVESCQ